MKNFRYVISIGLTVLALVSLSSFFPESVSARGCGGPYPPKPAHVWAKPGPGGGQVTLSWDEVPYANRYAVAYGTSSGNYQYGATNIGGSSSRSYTVSGLSSGTQYYFRLAGAKDCSSSPFSDEVSAWAGSGAVQNTVLVNWQAGTGGTQTWTDKQKATTSSNFSAWSGPGVGQVTLKWWPQGEAENYHLVYGTTKGHDEYGALKIGREGQMTVKSLVPGKTYYFSIVSVKGNRAWNTSAPAQAVAKAPVVVVQTISENVIPQTNIVVPQKVDLEQTGNEDGVEEDNMYEEENRNVQGLMDENGYESEDENYAAENQAVDEQQFAPVDNIGSPETQGYSEPPFEQPEDAMTDQDNQQHDELRFGSPEGPIDGPPLY